MSNSNFNDLKIYLLSLLLVSLVLKTKAQSNSNKQEALDVIVKTTGRLLTANKLIMIIDVKVPKGWKLNVEYGYQSMLEDAKDTVSLALKFKSKEGSQIAQRLKADRKPSSEGYYYENIVFAQTLRIDTSKLPIYIDAKMRMSFSKVKEIGWFRKQPCCLLKVCRKRNGEKTLKIGWNCNRRENVYLEDVR